MTKTSLVSIKEHPSHLLAKAYTKIMKFNSNLIENTGFPPVYSYAHIKSLHQSNEITVISS